MLQQSFDTVIAILAVLKVGAAYLPIKTDTPATRVGYILTDAKPPLVLGHQQCQALYQEAATDTTPFIALDSDAFATDTADFNDDFVMDVPSDTAYVIFTSGSTGRPKGVQVSHRNLINLTYNLKQLLEQRGINGHYRWCWTAPYIFDASLQGLSQLAFGCELHLMDEQTRKTPTLTAQYLSDNAIDLLDTTPALLEVLLSQGIKHQQHLPNILVGGDAISDHLWQKIADITVQHQIKAMNVYGPTECTVDATFADITPGSTPNIGQPLANISAHILDQYGREVPHGAVGELWLSGECVATGYLNNPQLTKQRFNAVQRRYQTGDLVSLDKEHRLLYHARRDDQLKFNGYRIEPGEIESVLRHVGNVSDALVIMRNVGQNQQLVAYLVAKAITNENQQVPSLDLHHHCARYLPQYMVPSHFVWLAKLPITANGKVDRQALPSPDISHAVSKREKTATEAQLYPLYQPMFGGSEFDIDADFFRIGGQSLMAMRLLVLIEQQFGVAITIADFNALSTLSQVAAYIDAIKQPEMEDNVIEELTI